VRAGDCDTGSIDVAYDRIDVEPRDHAHGPTGDDDGDDGDDGDDDYRDDDRDDEDDDRGDDCDVDRAHHKRIAA
jgi:hypothetical protein